MSVIDLRLGFLASRGGSNMAAILESVDRGVLRARPKALISNNPAAKALAIASDHGLATYVINDKTHADEHSVDEAICEALLEHEVNLVILNGYMKKIGPKTLATFDGHILNIHPSLLPKFGGQGMYGMRVHEAVLTAGEMTTGVTVHVIDDVYDRGRILRQAEVPVAPHDTPQTLAARVLTRETKLYVEVLQAIAAGDIRL